MSESKNQNTDIVKSKPSKVSKEEAHKAFVNKLDANGDGVVGLEDIITQAMRLPGIKVNRDAFLRKELDKYVDNSIVDMAIEYNPAYAEVNPKIIDHIAKEVIKFERRCVSAISTALGMPGGLAMIGTIPVDILQFYGYMLRAAQKLMYLYGFQSIDSEDGEEIDTETMNNLVLCIGVMFGVNGARAALVKLADELGKGVAKKLVKQPLTKGIIYPTVKKILILFQQKITKEVFAHFFEKAIPVIGGFISGGITYLSFTPCCKKLQKGLKDTILNNPEYFKTQKEISD